MKIKRKNLIASILLAICVCIGLCVFAIPTNNVVYATGATKYELSETRHEVYIHWKDSISPSDLTDYGFASVDLKDVSRDPETDQYLIKAGYELSVNVNIDARTGITLSRLYYTNKTDSSTEIDIDLATLQFTMPAYDIMIHAEFNEPTRYTITKSSTTGGKFYVRDWAYEGFPFDIEISPDAGYKLKGLSFVYDSGSNRYTIPTQNNKVDKFTMPKGNITMYAEFEKIPYTITIPEQVTVKRGEEILDNTSSVYVGDELTFIFDTPEHFSTYIRVNNNKYFYDSPKTFTVETQNVNIEYFSEQDMWQITWAESENYTILFDAEAGEPEHNGAWFWEGDYIVLSITPAQGYKITRVLANTQELTAENGKYSFSMLNCDIVISVELEKVYMMDWTDEDTYSFTIKNGETLAESPDWFEKGETLTITVTPQPGYRVTKIFANDVQISTSNEAIYTMQENDVDFTAEVEKIVYSVVVYEWYATYNGGKKEEFKYISQQTATIGDTVSILHRHNEKFYSCGDIFYCLLEDPTNFDTDEFYNAYENCYSADVWDENDIDFDTMPAGNIAVFFELYENSYSFDVPENVTITILESDGIVLETPDVWTNNRNVWINIYSRIKITIEQTDHFITKLYAYNPYFHSDMASSLYLGDKEEITGVLYDLIESQFDKFNTTSNATKLITTQTQFEWMTDWTDEDTHSFTIKKGETLAESPDWFEKGETLTITVTPQPGYRVTKIFANDVQISTSNEAIYTMQENDVDFTAEVEKTPYSITIPNEVTVKSEGTILTNSDNVYIDDVLTITYNSTAHFETIVKVNNTPIASGNTFTVETANVVITYERNQIEWQISWGESEDYTINVFNGDVIVSNGDWIANGVELTISITPNTPETHEVTKVLINGNPVVLENGKFTTTKQNIAIAAVVEAKEIVIRNDNDHAIVVDERENIKTQHL